MKKIISIVLMFIIIFSFNTTSLADDLDEENIDEDELKEDILNVSTTVENIPKTNSRAVLIFDRTSKRVIYEKNGYDKRAMASTTKIMSAIVILENAKLTDTVTISKKAGGTGGSRLGLKENDKVTVNDLLYGLMLRSGNDAAVALAEHVGGDIQGFAELMNKKAIELGLQNTHFVTPHGLDQDEHYTTAYELAKITDYALNIKKFCTIVNTKQTAIHINGNEKQITNTNELLGYLNGVDGVKTGFTNNAGRCLVTSTSRNGHQIVCVVLGADTKKIRTTDSIKLIEYAFANYEYINIKEKIEDKFEEWKKDNVSKIQIIKGVNKAPQVILGNQEYDEIPINKNNIKDIQIEINYEKTLQAPLEQNQVIGTVEVKIKNETITTVDIQLKETIEKKNIFNYMIQIITNYNYYIKTALNSSN